MKPRTLTIKVKAIVWATCWKPYDVTKLDNLGFGKYRNAITNVMMERYASPTGPTEGKEVRPSDSVILLGCRKGDEYRCHFIRGSELAEYRMGNVREKLKQLVLEEDRVEVDEIAITDEDKIPKIFDDFLEVIERVGPNPYKEM